MNKIIMGKVCVGVAHPLYNKVVELEVLSEGTGYNGRLTRVRTTKPVLFSGMRVMVFDKYCHFLRSEVKPDYEEYVEGWLVV